MEPLDLPLVVKVQPSFLVNFSTSCLSAAVVVGTPAVLTPAEVAAVGGTLVVSAVSAAEAAAVTVEGTVEAVVLVAVTLGDSADD